MDVLHLIAFLRFFVENCGNIIVAGTQVGTVQIKAEAAGQHFVPLHHF